MSKVGTPCRLSNPDEGMVARLPAAAGVGAGAGAEVGLGAGARAGVATTFGLHANHNIGRARKCSEHKLLW